MSRFPNGARVCFIGDSITHNNLHVSHVVDYYREHFADAKVEFYNCGISGGTLTTTLNCFDEDIPLYNPTHAVIMIGINDSARWALPFTGEEKYSYVATLDEIRENDYNLNIPRYVDTFEEEELIDIEEVQKNIADIEAELKVVQEQMKKYLEELGL
jgi:type I restriction-modification system DNA methylase subunit